MRSTLLTILILLFVRPVFSEALLVASHDMSWMTYRDQCLAKNYKCFPEAYIELIDPKNIFYQNLISDFDLDNNQYIESFHKNFLSVIKTEMLDLEQFEYLLLAAEKILAQKSNQNLKKDYIFFNEILLELQKADSVVLPEKSLILFRKSVDFNLLSKKQLSRLSEIKHYKISYNQNLMTKKYFLTGDCTKPHYHFELNDENSMTLLPVFNDNCSLTESFSQSTEKMGKHFEKNKMTYIWSALAISAVMFLKTHDVSFK